jgi:hypothetical protein
MALLLTTNGKLERTTKNAAFKRVGQVSLLPHPSIMAGKKMVYPREVYVSDEYIEEQKPTNQWGIVLAFMGYICPVYGIWGDIAIPHRSLAKLEQFFNDSKDFLNNEDGDDEYDDKQTAAIIRLKWQDAMGGKEQKKEEINKNINISEPVVEIKSKRKTPSTSKISVNSKGKTSKRHKKETKS